MPLCALSWSQPCITGIILHLESLAKQAASWASIRTESVRFAAQAGEDIDQTIIMPFIGAKSQPVRLVGY
jgi:hypothetical protein